MDSSGATWLLSFTFRGALPSSWAAASTGWGLGSLGGKSHLTTQFTLEETGRCCCEHSCPFWYSLEWVGRSPTGRAQKLE